MAICTVERDSYYLVIEFDFLPEKKGYKEHDHCFETLDEAVAFLSDSFYLFQSLGFYKKNPFVFSVLYKISKNNNSGNDSSGGIKYTKKLLVSCDDFIEADHFDQIKQTACKESGSVFCMSSSLLKHKDRYSDISFQL